VTQHLTESGIPGITTVPWGTHVCLYYRTREDLVHGVIPYLAAGLKNGEKCVWGTSSPLYPDEIRTELAGVVPEFDRQERTGRIEIRDHHEWYAGHLDSDPAKDLLRLEKEALQAGFTGLRCGGSISWLTRQDWPTFHAYEMRLNRAVHDRRILAICCYNVEQCEGIHVYESMRNHHFSLGRGDREWELLGLLKSG
jgi:hypothetical protein